jgi:hypothetical protein
MPSFEFDIGEQQRVGSRFIADVRDEIQRAVFSEKEAQKISQQQIATKIGTSRSVINRQIMGLENMTLSRVAEILWAIGWYPKFKAEKIPAGENYFSVRDFSEKRDSAPIPLQKAPPNNGALDPATQKWLDQITNPTHPSPVPLASAA